MGRARFPRFASEDVGEIPLVRRSGCGGMELATVVWWGGAGQSQVVKELKCRYTNILQ
ncbi:Hypothetical predicted protein [Olea europaea subsp. europaea]|uniref:Uncharacterized protein n=1 Tax=Olea europaea subsp. europaea TaxID=158383 RepID=A0A8S0PPK9_OLEEU|nr:Hypothetical predicted protein [Olea europaea subsp. europaea]